MPQTDTETRITKRVVVDMDRCIECGSCAAACYYSHANYPIVNFAGWGPALLPMICRQCKAAPCVEACPVEAMVQDEQGVARRRLFRCIGCGSCAKACPFGVIPPKMYGNSVDSVLQERINGRQSAKCDLCEDRILIHEEAVPRCVAACPAGALQFVDEHHAAEEGISQLGARTTGEDPYKRR